MKLAKILLGLVFIALIGVIAFIFTQSEESESTQTVTNNFTEIRSGRQGDDPLYSEEIRKNSALTLDMQNQLSTLDNRVSSEIAQMKQQSQRSADKTLNQINALKQSLERLSQQPLGGESSEKLVVEVKDSMKTEIDALSNAIQTLQQAVKDTASSNAKKYELLQSQIQQQLQEKVGTVKIPDVAGVTQTFTPTPSTNAFALITKPYGSQLIAKKGVESQAGNAFDKLGNLKDKISEKLGGTQLSLKEKKPDVETGVKEHSASQQQPEQWETVFPVYTLPPNTIMADAKLITPMIGSVPNITGSVTDPYFFKIEIGSENLAANGHRIPGIAKMFASGFATGVREQSCARGYINSLTFVFVDGRIVTHGKTAQAGDSNSQSIGYISDRWGKPCIRGEYINNGKDYLMSRGLASFLESAAQGLAQGQVTVETNSNGSRQAILDGDIWSFIFGQGVSGSAAEVAAYVRERALNAVDIVYVTQDQPVQIFINEMVPIDYDSEARVVNYYAEPKVQSSYD